MPTLLKPDRLNFGDTIGIIAPASPPPDPYTVDLAIEALECHGFKPKLGKNVRARLGFIAGTDRERAADVMAMFTDKKVNAIFCIRGGYGTTRILDRLDYAVIRRNPKILSGYSDITALHGVLLKKAGLISFHAPMLNGALADPKVPEFTKQSFFRAIMEAKAPGSICAGYDGKTVSSLRGGVAEGRLAGGNLSLICAGLGTPFAPSYKGKILFLEDVNEKPYRLDRMLTHLWNAGVFAQVAGVAVGVNRENNSLNDPALKTVRALVKPPGANQEWKEVKVKAPAKEYQQSGAEVVKERLSGLRVPVVVGLPFGHIALNATIPVGVRARLDADKGDLIITEAAVK